VAAWVRLVERVGLSLRALPEARRGLVVAVSGGADSVALLRALLAAAGSEVPLTAAHLNHGLRGPESDADEVFVAELCARLGVALCRRRLDVRAAGDNVEATARRLRYGWLTEVARGCGAAWVATGHTADDQAETVLFRLLRGAGLQGLRGIAARRPLAEGIGVVRPLLGATRAEVREGLRESGQVWREDSSNADLSHTRNRIRHQLLPLLEREFNPGVTAALARLAAQADEVFRAEEAEAAALLAEAELPRAGARVILDRERLTRAPRRAVRAALRLLWQREGWPAGAMSFAHWERLAGVVFDDAEAIELPGRVRARRCGRVVQVGRSRPRG
jgi:tRNA(Ile)-lysidine synthase